MTVRIIPSARTQVRRSAQALRNGEQILAEVDSHKAALIAAADRGVPPVSAISEKLRRKFPRSMKAAAVRQFVGIAVKAILAEEGYEVAQSGVRLPRDAVFRTGSVYRKSTAVTDVSEAAVHDAFARMVQGLTPIERRILVDVLRKASGES